MKILIIGNGGREHAIGRKLSQSPRNPEIIFAPGNPGMEALGSCFAVTPDDFRGLLTLAQTQKVDLTIVGPEQPLVGGLVDLFEANGLRVFGPNQAAAALEGSKAFSKDFMERHRIPTARFRTFRALEPARAYLREMGAPIVVKASGLAGGKGAVVCMTMPEAESALQSKLGPKATFGVAGSEVVVEEFMEGEEASVFALTDGEAFVLLPSAQDHKRIGDGDTGPNTGGMGAYAPAPIMTPELIEEVSRTIISPTLNGMRAEGTPYKGILYVGFMVTP
jgi:phosphoribosylamine--glycine ligase